MANPAASGVPQNLDESLNMSRSGCVKNPDRAMLLIATVYNSIDIERFWWRVRPAALSGRLTLAGDDRWFHAQLYSRSRRASRTHFSADSRQKITGGATIGRGIGG
jgi:hypothetical protein